MFTHLSGERATVLNEVLTHGGFRRSQNIAYRPACERCRSCVSVRILVDEFAPNKSQQRILRRNADLVGAELEPVSSSEQYGLFRDYLHSRHAGGGMVDMSVFDYAMMVEDTAVETRLVEYRPRGADSGLTRRGAGPLVAVALSDVMSDGLSMVYSFFDPDETRRSLGTFMILDHVERARRRGLPYVYLGYWVEGSRKMGYKIGFLPQEHLSPRGWTRVGTHAEASALARLG